ncbi:MAG: amidohydrolase family protein [Myxococcales bacterium]|nr:amidohydrolase family protein [Myxococcales bacterium]
MVVHAQRALVAGEIRSGVAIETREDGAITAVRPARATDPGAVEGLVVPGLVNAHLHLELSWAAGQIPGGQGLPAWVRTLQRTARPQDARQRAAAAACEMAAAGTALVCDISNGGDTAPLLRAAELAGIVQHEVLGMGRALIDDPAMRARAEAAARWEGAVAIRPTPHATYSVPERWLKASGAERAGVVGSIHLQEDPGEVAFVEHGTGPFAAFLDDLGIDWSWYTPSGLRPVAWLASLGVLGPHLMAVHGVHLSADDLQQLVAADVPLCLCARSNAHIGGQLPDVPRLLASGIRLCLGTDSLGSSPDLDVLGEVAALIRAFPDVPASTWLVAATAGGAAALARPQMGVLREGACGGVLLLEGVQSASDLAEPPARRWLVPPPHGLGDDGVR